MWAARLVQPNAASTRRKGASGRGSANLGWRFEAIFHLTASLMTGGIRASASTDGLSPTAGGYRNAVALQDKRHLHAVRCRAADARANKRQGIVGSDRRIATAHNADLQAEGPITDWLVLSPEAGSRIGATTRILVDPGEPILNRGLSVEAGGGLRTTVWRNEIRVDNVQHVLMALLKILEVFDSEDYRLGAEASRLADEPLSPPASKTPIPSTTRK